MTAIAIAALIAALAFVLWPRPADAHCDTLDGPAVADGRRALETGNLNHALKWIPQAGEAELREVFEQCVGVRALGEEAAAVADRLFLETLVRIHRASEGEPFDGLKPFGTALAPEVVAADRAIELESADPLIGVLPDDRLAEATERLDAALALKHFDVDDVAAGREFIAAYVNFFKYAEGEEHHHAHPEHAHAHHH